MARRKRSSARRVASPGSRQSTSSTSFKNAIGVRRTAAGGWPIWLIILAGGIAYANAMPDALVLDDPSFAVAERFSALGPADFLSFFTEDLWAASGVESGLYRPVLLISIAIDAFLFGDWIPGYHLTNIILHVIVSLLVYGFCRQLLQSRSPNNQAATQAALWAALVFAVHPVHTEVVNSIFNRSELLVGIGVIGSLWWFTGHVERRPKLAWAGMATVYFLVLLSKESGVTLPALAVLVLWINGTGGAGEKVRRCLPVLWLILPLALYLVLRFAALQSGTKPADAISLLDASRLPDVVISWLVSLRFMVWPHPLQIFHSLPDSGAWYAGAFQLLLLGLALAASVRGRPGLLFGLLFFYISLLPSSRIIGESSMLPHVAERYLYLPSVGLAIVLAFEFRRLAGRHLERLAQVGLLAALLVGTAVTWARNADWSDAVRLAESDYAKDPNSGRIVETLVEALLADARYKTASQLCDERFDELQENWFLSNSCGVAWSHSGRLEDAEQAFQWATAGGNEASARFNLAGVYLNSGRRQQAQEQFAEAIAIETNPFLKEFRTAEMLVRLYPRDRARLLEARAHLEAALDLQPQFFQARSKLRELNGLLQGHSGLGG